MISMNTSNTMSEALKSAQNALERCEVEVCDLVGEAAKDKDYKAVDRLSELAQNLEHLKKSLEAHKHVSLSLPTVSEQREAFDRQSNMTTKKPRQSKQPTRRRTRRPTGYPKFEVEGNSLVKISWSKTKKSEYVHKAPKRVLESLIQTLLGLGGKREIVATERMFPLENNGNQFPDYQSYLCLLWLKQNKLVIHHGREGYQVNEPDSLQTNCELCFAKFYCR